MVGWRECRSAGGSGRFTWRGGGWLRFVFGGCVACCKARFVVGFGEGSGVGVICGLFIALDLQLRSVLQRSLRSGLWRGVWNRACLVRPLGLCSSAPHDPIGDAVIPSLLRSWQRPLA